MEKETKKYLFFLFFVVLLFYSYMIIKNFIIILFSSAILAYILLPLHKKISKKTGPKISSLICISLAILFLGVVFFIVGQNIYIQINEIVQEKSVAEAIKNLKNFVDEKNIPYSSQIFYLFEKIIDNSLSLLSKVFLNFLKGFFSLILVFFTTYYFLIYWEDITKKFYELFPFENKKEIFEKIGSISDGVIRSTMIIALIEGIFTFVFLYFMNIKYAIFFSFIVALLAFIPMIGPGVFWMPAVIFNFLNGNYFLSLSFLIYGIVISYCIDSLLRNIISSKEAKINPVTMLFGVLGGISFFGLPGIIIGPVILTVTIQILFSFAYEKTK